MQVRKSFLIDKSQLVAFVAIIQCTHKHITSVKIQSLSQAAR